MYQTRPTLYQVVKEMTEKMGYEVCLCLSLCVPPYPDCVIIIPTEFSDDIDNQMMLLSASAG